AISDNGVRMASGIGSRRRYSHIADPENRKQMAGPQFTTASDGSRIKKVAIPTNAATPARTRTGRKMTAVVSRSIFGLMSVPILIMPRPLESTCHDEYATPGPVLAPRGRLRRIRPTPRPRPQCGLFDWPVRLGLPARADRR